MIGYIILGIVLVILIFLFIVAYKIHSSTFGKRFDVDPKVKYYTKEEFDLNATDVFFKCGNNTLRGHLYSYDNPIENKIIVYAHGMWSSTKAYLQDIEYLCRNGYKVLGFDYIGTDLSDGKGIKALANGLKSLDYAIRYVKKEFPNDNIYVVGHSWGAHNTINVTKYHKDIKAIVAISPFNTLNRLLKGLFPKKLWFMIFFVKLVEIFKCGKYAFSNSAKALKKYKGKAFIIHSKDDHMVNYKLNTEYIMKKCNNAKYLIVEGHAHNPNYTKEAVNKLASYLQELRGLPLDKQDEYKEKTDFHALGELDLDIMNEIVEFIKK